ncbi:hypothetical protein SAMN05421761_11325 [Belliella pelovolcani]|uniref:Uncharacterized protein n=1 Tax=Belliella pelovolcani TaxID=529505 RepID=A0A1N7P134_9BACT|nr:hypothetical protein SAMN05421761_11325 [Belliella pelovolcani]
MFSLRFREYGATLASLPELYEVIKRSYLVWVQ